MHWFKRLRGNVADFLATTIAPDILIFNKKNPFDTFEDQTKVYGLSALAAQQMVRACHRTGSDKATFTFSGYSIARQEIGDWRVTVERINSGSGANRSETVEDSANCLAERDERTSFGVGLHHDSDRGEDQCASPTERLADNVRENTA